MATIYISPKPIQQPIIKHTILALNLKSGAANVSFDVHIALDKNDSQTYALESCSVLLPTSCFTSKSASIQWEDKPAQKIEGTISGQHLSFVVPVPSGSSLKNGCPIVLHFKELTVAKGTGLTGNLEVDLEYKGRHNRSESFTSGDVINVKVTNQAGVSANNALSVSNVVVNNGTAPSHENTKGAIYPSLFSGQNLKVPIANTIELIFNWEGNKNLPKASSSGAFIISFDYGPGFNLASNQLVSNDYEYKGKGFTIFDWEIETVHSFYNCGPNKGASITWNKPTISHGAGTLGNINLNTAQVIDWQQDFQVSMVFTKVVSGNPLVVPNIETNVLASTNAYVQSTGLPDVQDQLITYSFLVSAAIPAIVSFNYSETKQAFEYEIFAANIGLLTWNNQNGQRQLNGGNTINGDYLRQKAIGSLDIPLTDPATWQCTYKGTLSGIYSAAANPDWQIQALNTDNHLISRSKSVDHSPESICPNFGIVAGSVKNLATVSVKGSTYSLLTWQVTGLGDYGFCILSDTNEQVSLKNDDQLSGSTDAGNAPYFYLYAGDLAQLNLIAYKDGNNQGKKQAAAIPSTISQNPIPANAMDVCIFNNVLYMAIQQNNEVNIHCSEDSINWTKVKLKADPPLSNGKPALTSNGKLLYIIIYTKYSGRNIWTSPDGKNWLQIKTELVTSTPSQVQIQFLPDQSGKLSAVYTNKNNNDGWVTQINENYSKIVSNIEEGLSVAYFDKYYYIAYQRTDKTLGLRKNNVFNNESYQDVNLPTIYVSGISRVTVFKDKLVIVYTKVGTYQLGYIWSKDGSNWSKEQDISLSARSFALAIWYGMLCIAYVGRLTSKINLETYLLTESDFADKSVVDSNSISKNKY